MSQAGEEKRPGDGDNNVSLPAAARLARLQQTRLPNDEGLSEEDISEEGRWFLHSTATDGDLMARYLSSPVTAIPLNT